MVRRRPAPCRARLSRCDPARSATPTASIPFRWAVSGTADPAVRHRALSGERLPELPPPAPLQPVPNGADVGRAAGDVAVPLVPWRGAAVAPRSLAGHPPTRCPRPAPVRRRAPHPAVRGAGQRFRRGRPGSPAPCPTWAFRAPAAPQQQPASYGDLALDPMSLSSKRDHPGGRRALMVDEQRPGACASRLRRSALAWPESSPSSRVSTRMRRAAPGRLVAVTHAGPVELPATRRPAGDLRYIHALLDAYRRAGRDRRPPLSGEPPRAAVGAAPPAPGWCRVRDPDDGAAAQAGRDACGGSSVRARPAPAASCAAGPCGAARVRPPRGVRLIVADPRRRAEHRGVGASRRGSGPVRPVSPPKRSPVRAATSALVSVVRSGRPGLLRACPGFPATRRPAAVADRRCRRRRRPAPLAQHEGQHDEQQPRRPRCTSTTMAAERGGAQS